MPALTGVLETCLYVANLDRASQFYETVLGLRPMGGDDRFRAYSVAERDVLLLFKKGASAKAVDVSGQAVPPHDGSGQNHFAFAIAASELPGWEKRLAEHDVAVEGRVRWPRGGTSIYFRDPDQNLGELATPGLWEIY